MPTTNLDQDHPAPDPDYDSPASPPTRHLGVLLVEDNIDDAILLERHLRRNGFEPKITRVETAPEMYAALTPLASSAVSSFGSPLDTPRVVIADYNLPNFSGPEALGMLKASGIDLPFIMMSGAVSEEARGRVHARRSPGLCDQAEHDAPRSSDRT